MHSCEAPPEIRPLRKPVRPAPIFALFGAGVACLIAVTPALSATASEPAPSPSFTADSGIRADPAVDQTSIGNRAALLGDLGGLRPWLGGYGITLQATEISEFLDNVQGGLKRGGAYDGLTTVTLGLDTQKAFGWRGGSFNVSVLQTHGRNLSQSNLGTLNTASGIQARDSTRLWEAWFQQSLLGDRLNIRIGQQSIDQEFMVSEYSSTFIGAMFGWPGLPSYDMPSGGPAYPLAALGGRIRAQLTPSLTALAGIYDGNPQGNDPGNIHGTNFNVHNGALYIGELQYAVNPPATGKPAAGDAGGLPGTYKIGFWVNSGRFADLHFDNAGVSLADAASSGTARSYHGDYSLYAVADQMIWRPDAGSPRSIGVFARVTGAPGDRNLVSLGANAGVVMKAPFAGRDNDSVGLGLAYIQVGSHAHDLDVDKRMLNGPSYGVRTDETAVEATYQYQVAPWWTVQGDLQYTLNAGAGKNPKDPEQPLHNTSVVGVRTMITF
jgi:porin